MVNALLVPPENAELTVIRSELVPFDFDKVRALVNDALLRNDAAPEKQKLPKVVVFVANKLATVIGVPFIDVRMFA